MDRLNRVIFSYNKFNGQQPGVWRDLLNRSLNPILRGMRKQFDRFHGFQLAKRVVIYIKRDSPAKCRQVPFEVVNV